MIKILSHLATAVFIFAASCATPLPALASGSSLTQTSSTQLDIGVFHARKAIKKIFSFTADSATGAVPSLSVQLIGRIKRITYVPGGTTVTNGTLISIIDSDSTVDVIFGQGAITTGATAQDIYPSYSPASGAYCSVSPLVSGTYTLKVTGNSVDSATGKVILYLTEE